MFFALTLILLLTFSSIALTYVFDSEAPLWARAAMGAVVGQVLFGTAGFAVGSVIGMNTGTILISILIACLPLALFRRKNIRRQFDADFAAFKSEVKNFFAEFPFDKAAGAALYVALFTLLWFFFERAMVVKPEGIFIGSSNNLGDLPFHLQGIYGFTDGQNFPPQNPSYAGSKFTYPFIVNLAAAMYIKLGAAVQDALFWQNITLIVSFVGLLHYFTFRLTGSRIAAHIAPLLFLFSGGLGFIGFFLEAAKSEKGFFGLIMNLQNDYSLRPDTTWRWGNTLTVLLITQRSMLIGLPFSLVILNGLWGIFTAEEKTGRQGAEETKSAVFNSSSPLLLFSSSIILGFLTGLLPLVHAHSYAVLMGMAGMLALLNIKNWKLWAAFLISASVFGAFELLWAMTGTANRAESFVAYQFGWDKGDENFLWFWFKNTGLFIPLLFAAIALLAVNLKNKFSTPHSEHETENSKFKIQNSKLLLFWLPFSLCFIVPNFVRLAPWIWDNIKVLIYWFLLSVPLVAWLLGLIWRRGDVGKALAVALIFVLTFAGFLDVWRVASRAFEYPVIAKDAVQIAEQIRRKTPPRALIMTAPIYNSPAVLTGRRWFMGFTGHLVSHGIDITERDKALRRIYAGTPDAKNLIGKYGINYILVGPHEREMIDVNDAFFRQFPVVAEAGAYRLYQVN
ncbi:MAG: hypothetical protein M3209_16950 [Acidobacteriota bacterium]|nr:hypothetical protein [Acidobacteriota bacterium]